MACAKRLVSFLEQMEVNAARHHRRQSIGDLLDFIHGHLLHSSGIVLGFVGKLLIAEVIIKTIVKNMG